jgi:hypothetical protein
MRAGCNRRRADFQLGFSAVLERTPVLAPTGHAAGASFQIGDWFMEMKTQGEEAG